MSNGGFEFFRFFVLTDGGGKNGRRGDSLEESPARGLLFALQGEKTDLVDDALHLLSIRGLLIFLTLSNLFKNDFDHGLAEFGDLRVIPDPQFSGPTTDDNGEARKSAFGGAHILQGYSVQPWSEEGKRESDRAGGGVA